MSKNNKTTAAENSKPELTQNSESNALEKEEFAEPVAMSKTEIKKRQKEEAHLRAQQKKNALKKARKKKKDESSQPSSYDEMSFRQIFKQMFGSKKKKNEPIVQKRVKRVKTDYQTGLTSDQVQERISKGQINVSPNTNNKTVGSIIFENVFTFF